MRSVRQAARRVALVVIVCCAPTPARAEEPEAQAEFRPTPEQLDMADRLDRLAAQYARSSDLRLRILYSMNGEVEEERRPADNGFYGKELVSAADLYAQARGSTDPLALDLLIQRCGLATKTMAACDRADLARRWTVADAQNQVAWITLAAVLKHQGDAEGARAAFVRAAQASRWHEHVAETARLVASAMPDSLPLPVRNLFLAQALAKGAAAFPFDAVSTLGTYCREGEPARTACRRILDTMVRDTGSELALTLAPPFASRAGLEVLVVARYQQEADAVHWTRTAAPPIGDVLDPMDERTALRAERELRLLIELGERRRAERLLLEQRVAKRDAAERYVATLSPWQLQNRAEATKSH